MLATDFDTLLVVENLDIAGGDTRWTMPYSGGDANALVSAHIGGNGDHNVIVVGSDILIVVRSGTTFNDVAAGATQVV